MGDEVGSLVLSSTFSGVVFSIDGQHPARLGRFKCYSLYIYIYEISMDQPDKHLHRKKTWCSPAIFPATVWVLYGIINHPPLPTQLPDKKLKQFTTGGKGEILGRSFALL